MGNLILHRIREKRRTKARNRLWSKAENEWRAEIERLREALFTIVCNTEPAAIKHRDYDHLANAIYVWASAALGEEK